MARSKAYMNVTGVTFVYGSSPTTVTITEIEEARPMRGGDVKIRGGDAAVGPTHKVVNNMKRAVTLVGADLGKMGLVPVGVLGTLVVVLLDTYNQTAAGAGSITLTLSNCSLDEDGIQAQHNEFSKHTSSFTAIWPDGVTDPYAAVEHA